jgi:hypothetical protein
MFRRYEAIGESEKEKSDEMKIDQWLLKANEWFDLKRCPVALFASVALFKVAVARLQIAFSSRLSIRRRSWTIPTKPKGSISLRLRNR